MEMFLILYYRINSMGILKFFSSKEKYNSIITFYSIMNLDEVLIIVALCERMTEQN